MQRPVSAFTIDLYELTMAAAYWTRKIHASASFELFVRRLPANRNFLIAAGLERALRVLGYRPTVSLREGLKRTWAWFADGQRLGAVQRTASVVVPA